MQNKETMGTEMDATCKAIIVSRHASMKRMNNKLLLPKVVNVEVATEHNQCVDHI